MGIGVTMSIYFVTSFLIQLIVLEKAFRHRLNQGQQALAEKQVLMTGFGVEQ